MIRSGMVAYHDDLAPLMRQIDKVSPVPYNYNNGDVDEIALSIEQSGMYRPIYAQAGTGHIIAGNHTWMACKALGADQVPVVFLDVDDATAKKIMVQDNEIARNSIRDNGLLVALLDDIKSDGLGLIGSGITDEEHEMLRKLNDIPLDTEEESFAQWPTFSVQVPPHVLRAFNHMTREADDDRQRFELILRMAGWDGRT